MWVILVFVSNPKVVTVFIFGLLFPISLSRTKVDGVNLFWSISEVQKVDDTEICAFKIRLI